MKKLHKNTNIATNSIRAYACATVCACASPGCSSSSTDSAMRQATRGAITLPYYS